MKDFLKKWNSDKKFKTSIQLMLYTSFVIIVAIFAVSNSENIPKNEINNTNDEQKKENNKENNAIIEIPSEYNYSIKININDNEYKYSGTKDSERKTISMGYAEWKL